VKLAIFADLHIYHPFAHSTSSRDVHYWYYQGIESYIREVVDKEHPDTVIFLGDIHHANFKSSDRYNYFRRLVDILRLEYRASVVVVVGNHDTSGSYTLEKARVIQEVPYPHYATTPQLHRIGDYSVLLLPFLQRERIIPVLSEFQTTDKVFILSHNNIYLDSTFYDTPMVKYSDVLNLLPSATLINGHIHRFYAEPGYYQLGSVNPTSYKEYLNAVGCCVVSEKGIKLYKNTHLFLLSCLSAEFLPELVDFLQKAEEYSSIVFLLSTPDVYDKVKQYSCIKAIQFVR